MFIVLVLCLLYLYCTCGDNPPGFPHNGFVANHALGNIMYGYTLLVPMNQRVLNKLSKEHNISDHK